ncbi:hypothetical protein QVD17_31248 [Tagetes erecta]|uniref:Retrotransposon gag domain-containing protein n=1 Tax=Tagetes erecta TaxID=13708 RepID=A0AAD8K6P1_TARER|nr:hypothetical protein QVD17_31248 [Tagetes erecta]
MSSREEPIDISDTEEEREASPSVPPTDPLPRVSDDEADLPADPLPRPRPRRFIVRSTTPEQPALGERPILYRKNNGPLMIKSARKRVAAPVTSEVITPTVPEEEPSTPLPPKKKLKYRSQARRMTWMPEALSRWRRLKGTPSTYEMDRVMEDVKELEKDVENTQGEMVDVRSQMVLDGLTVTALRDRKEKLMAPQRRSARRSTGSDDPMSPAAIEQLIAQRVASDLAQYEANRNGNGGSGSGTGDGAGGSGTRGNPNGNGSGDTGHTQKGCSYKTFMSCNPRTFHGTEGAVGVVRWIEKTESVLDISNCADDCMVKYATCTLTDKALTWWNSQVKTLGREAAYQLTWEELKAMMIEEYCPRNELQKLEADFWALEMVGANISGYTDKFNELATLLPHMVTPEFKRVERYLWGLAPQIRGMVTASNPVTAKSAIALAHKLTDDTIRDGSFKKVSEDKKVGDKRKWDSKSDNKYGNHQSKKQNTVKAFAAGTAVNTVEPKKYNGPHPKCNKCGYHHINTCDSIRCDNCKRMGHTTRNCRAAPA